MAAAMRAAVAAATIMAAMKAAFPASTAAGAGWSAARPALAGQPDIAGEIRDPATGDCWLLERNPAAPGGPGRLVRIAAGEPMPRQAAKAGRQKEKASPPAIRAGDRVVVEEHTAAMDAELEGVALNGARSGSMLRVRLKIGGRVVNAVALAAGRAAIRPAAGVRP
jgi:hypothetical protein